MSIKSTRQFKNGVDEAFEKEGKVLPSCIAGTSRGTWQVPREVGTGYLARCGPPPRGQIFGSSKNLVEQYAAKKYKLRALGLPRVPLRPLRGSGFALGQPDAFGAGAFPLRSFAPLYACTCARVSILGCDCVA